MNQFRHRQCIQVCFEFIVRPTKHLQQCPLRERLQFAIWLHHRDHFAACKQINAARKTSALTSRAFGQPAHDSLSTTKQTHGLTRLRPVPLANTYGVINKIGHDAIVPWRASTCRDIRSAPKLASSLHTHAITRQVERLSQKLDCVPSVSMCT